MQPPAQAFSHTDSSLDHVALTTRQPPQQQSCMTLACHECSKHSWQQDTLQQRLPQKTKHESCCAGMQPHASLSENYHLTVFMTSQPGDPRADPFTPGGGIDPLHPPVPIPAPTSAVLQQEIDVCRQTALTAAPAFEVQFCEPPFSQKRNKRKDYAFRRQFNEKPSIILGCPVPFSQPRADQADPPFDHA